jgi:transposase-like protein
MARPPKYTEAQRAAALAALAAAGGNLAETARQTGIPRKTLETWVLRSRQAAVAETGGGVIAAEKKVAETVAETPSAVSPAALALAKAGLADKLEGIAQRIADAMPDKIEKAGLQQCAVSLGITVEKMRLLREQPTQISDDHVNHNFTFEQLCKLPPDELVRIHRETLGLPPPGRN